MQYRSSHKPRRGVVLIVMVMCLLSLFAFLALAIDVGMLATARTAAQDAADAAALAGIRTLNGYSTNNNYSNVTPNAQAVATANKIFGTSLTNSNVTVNIGRYTYDSTTQQFSANFPGTSGAWTAVQVAVNTDVSGSMTFSKLLNTGSMNVQTTATAVHRPRDIAIILDYSGSMRFASLTGIPYSSARTGSNNADTNVPSFGHYSSTNDNLTATSFSSPYDAANITATTSDGRPPVCADFYQDATGTPAFSVPSSNYTSTPGGDNCLKTSKNTGANYATNVYDILGTTSKDNTFESSGYKAYSMRTTFNRYTQGPGYYGKTFWIWP
ncbi:MAG: pilus assembly protein TadG-related protein, partial [Chthoniobacteraceae bacterium]